MYKLEALVFTILAFVSSANAEPLRATLSSEATEVTLGQPLVVSLKIINDSNRVITVVPSDRDVTQITITRVDGSVVRIP